MNIDMFSALNNIMSLRKRIEYNRKKADELSDRILSVGVSNIYGNISTKSSYNHRAHQELVVEESDLRKTIFEDLTLLYDTIAVLEDAVMAIPDYDTRVIIKNKYLNGLSDEEIEGMFFEHESGYCYQLEHDYFRSLKEASSTEAS